MVKKNETIKHAIIPKHIKIAEKEKGELMKSYGIDETKLPRIFDRDPAISHLSVKSGDVIKITRKSPTAGESVFYRVVINE